MTLNPSRLYTMTRHAVSATGTWAAEATLACELNCPRRANGCGLWSNAPVTPDEAVSSEFGLSSAFVVLLKPLSRRHRQRRAERVAVLVEPGQGPPRG